MIKILKTKDEFIAFKQDWNEFYAQLDYVTPFQSYSFNFNSWSKLESDERLYIICIYREVNMLLQAIFPCIITKKGILQFINGIHSDFCGALILEDVRKDYHLYKEFVDYINDTVEIKGFMFDNLKEDNYMSAVFGYFFKGMQTRIANKWSYFHVNAKQELDKTYLDSMSHLSRKDKYKLVKVNKKFAPYNMKLFKISENSYPKDIVDSIIHAMLALGIRTEAYFSDDFKSIIENLYNDGVLSVAVTYKGNEPLVANLYLIQDNEYINWLVVYKERRYNTMNLLQSVEYIYNNGGGILNFARGIYEYKVSNFRPEIHNLYRVEYSKNFIGKVGNLLSFYKYYLKVFLKPYIRH